MYFGLPFGWTCFYYMRARICVYCVYGIVGDPSQSGQLSTNIFFPILKIKRLLFMCIIPSLYIVTSLLLLLLDWWPHQLRDAPTLNEHLPLKPSM